MKNILRILNVIFVLTPALVITQNADYSIKGFVFDQTTGEGLPSVNVLIKGTKIGTITNEKGYFYFEKLKIGSYEIEFYHVGYKPITIKDITIRSNKIIQLEIALNPTVYETNAVVITATRSLHTLKDVPVETYLIDNKEFKGTGVQTLTDIIRWVPGITISGGAPNGAARRFTSMIHGLPAQYSMILVDGERSKSEHIHTGTNLNLIPVSMINRVEVIKGPASVLYGSEAFGGVVNIITKPVPTTPSYGLELSYGEYNTENMNLYYGNTFNNFGYYINANYLHSDGTPDASASQFDYDQSNLLAKINYQLTNKNSFSLNTRYYRNKYLRNATKPKVVDTWMDFSADWCHQFNKKSSLKTALYYSFFKGEYRNDNNRTVMGEAILEKKLKNHSIISGLELRAEQFSRIATPQKKTTISSFFFNDELKMHSQFTPFLAFRVDHHPNIGTVWTPKIGALYNLDNKTDVRASIGKGYRAPSLQDLYEDKFDHKTYYRDGNINLKPEYSINYNLGLEHRFNDHVVSRAAVFYNDFKDMIMLVPSGQSWNGKPVLIRENIQNAIAQGIETEMNIIWGTARLMLAYIYSDNHDKDGNPLAYSPKYMTIFRLYKYLPNFKIYTMLSLEDARNRYYKTTTNEKDVLKNYTLLNLSFNKQFLKRFTVFFRIENLLNSQFEIYEDGKSLAGYGRSMLGGIKFEF